MATPASTGMCSPVVCESSLPVRTATAFADVFRQDLALEQGALGVVLAQVLLVDAVDGGAFGAPAAGEDPGAADDAVGVDPVDPDAVLAQFGGEEPDLVRLVGFGRGVGDVVRAGEDGVLRGDVDDVPAHALVDEDLRGGLGDQEGALGHDVVLDVPVLLRGLQQRLGDGEPGVVDHQVQPAEGQHRGVHRCGDLGLVGDIGLDPDGDVRTAELRRGSLCGLQVQVRDDDAGALGREAGGDGLADARRRPGHQCDAGGVGLRFGQPRQFGLLQRPVFDPEFLGFLDRGVRGDGLRAAHYVDRVEVVLPRHPCGLLVLAVGEHAHPRDQDDRGVRPAQGR